MHKKKAPLFNRRSTLYRATALTLGLSPISGCYNYNAYVFPPEPGDVLHLEHAVSPSDLTLVRGTDTVRVNGVVEAEGEVKQSEDSLVHVRLESINLARSSRDCSTPGQSPTSFGRIVKDGVMTSSLNGEQKCFKVEGSTALLSPLFPPPANQPYKITQKELNTGRSILVAAAMTWVAIGAIGIIAWTTGQ